MEKKPQQKLDIMTAKAQTEKQTGSTHTI